MLELVFDDDGAVRRMPIRDGMTLGRSSDNDVVLRDFSVSRHHARLVGEGAAFRLVDLKSTNGVKINGSAVADGVLQAGDRVEIGSFRLTVSDGGLADADLAPTTYVRPLSEFNRRFGLEGSSSMPAAAGSGQSAPPEAVATTSRRSRRRTCAGRCRVPRAPARAGSASAVTVPPIVGLILRCGAAPGNPA